MTQAEVNAYQARRLMNAKSNIHESCDDESDLHNQIFDECQRRGWIALHGSMASRTHRTKGEPDFVIIGAGVWFIECKSAAGKLTTDQRAMIVHAAKLGTIIHVVRSFSDFRDVIDGPQRHEIRIPPSHD
jgi:hypothetical protein